MQCKIQLHKKVDSIYDSIISSIIFEPLQTHQIENKVRHRDREKSVDAFAELEMNERVRGPGKIGRREVLGNFEQMRQN